MNISLPYLKTPSGILKIVEIVTVVIAFSILRSGMASFSVEESTVIHANMFGGGVLITAMIITPLLLICYLMGRYEIQKTVFEMAFNFLMFLFLICLGSAGLDEFRNSYVVVPQIWRKSIALGSFCIISSIAYLGDFVCAVVLFRK